MTTLGIAESTAGIVNAGGLSALQLVTFLGPRSIGDIQVMCAIKEEHHHELAVTQHPVEQGAQIADHAYVLADKVVLTYGWSDSFNTRGGGFGFAKATYDALLALRNTRAPFTLVAGQRTYDNMLMTLLVVPTDVEAPNAVRATIHCQQVILVEAETAQIAAAPTASMVGVGSNSVLMQAPEETMPTQLAGTKQLLPAPTNWAEPTDPTHFGEILP